MNERKENQQQDQQVRPMARILARELSPEEVARVAGGNPWPAEDGPSGCFTTSTDQQL